MGNTVIRFLVLSVLPYVKKDAFIRYGRALITSFTVLDQLLMIMLEEIIYSS